MWNKDFADGEVLFASDLNLIIEHIEGIDTEVATHLLDAPSDGVYAYGRKDATWIKVCQDNDARLSDPRIPTSHDNTYHTTAFGTGDMLKSVYDTNNNGVVDAAESVAWSGVTGKPTLGTSSELNVATTGNASATEVVKGDDTRLSDPRTPITHDNSYHSATYITSLGVTYENLNINGDIGSTEGTVCAGDDSRLSNNRDPTSHATTHITTDAIPSATTSDPGLLSASDKTKLDGIEANANNYTLPTATDTILGGVKIGSGIEIIDGVISVSIGSPLIYKGDINCSAYPSYPAASTGDVYRVSATGKIWSIVTGKQIGRAHV